MAAVAAALAVQCCSVLSIARQLSCCSGDLVLVLPLPALSPLLVRS